ncbi:hypothetical protein Kpol_520p31 [Vanderwaltozyma polyspora DSM 70294]|uniref:Dihydroxyacetone kinase n=1 Tax=Vanderwaltozyma polyspora (strain ATCC 22028 / DSM 70294 / BCRC 21397 / CBS 2163 / NBRC 10782 / NRRL Y-8283 / UCD 57-17) TaxID=436907 RepID=A7TMB4_VANPO|nr:uncharacterized protein Kpol_520p31 [Vanderwaltozyma polyspora DSM 70294]EDO16608.1 hypothetical protein Kpol_520p31 [Vanderwaltozyma polyspora DSM 70294]
MAVKSFEVSDPLGSTLKGFALAHPSITLVPEEKILFRKTDKTKIALISGGGSGHEPTHGGFVGNGMLSAAVCGDIFASPSTKQILNAITLVSENASGVLLIVKNYTGDVLHFGLAAERARALGINCKVAVIGDDTAVGRAKGGMVGRRALAGTVLVHKIVGSFTETYSERYGLEGASKVAQIINDNLVTIGASLDHCKVPGRKFETEINDNQMELGMGIHNEPGVKVLEPIPSTEDLISKHMLPCLLDSSDRDRYFVDFDKDDEVVLLINNLGGVSNLILSSIVSITTDFLKSNYGITPVQSIAGTLMTAFNGNGFSITLLNATKATASLQKEFPEIKSVFDLLNSKTDAPFWPAQSKDVKPAINEELLKTEVKVKDCGSYNFNDFSRWMQGGAKAVIKAEPHITSLDTLVGDGDCGYTLVAGVNGITKNLDDISKVSLSEATAQLSDIIESTMGGTSGGLYSILISGFSHALIQICADENVPVSKEVLARAFEMALETLYKYTNARPGSSTMVDALEPFVKEFSSSKDFKKAVAAADAGAKSTGSIEAKFGRASYVGESAGIEDPGAVGLVAFLQGIESVL